MRIQLTGKIQWLAYYKDNFCKENETSLVFIRLNDKDLYVIPSFGLINIDYLPYRLKEQEELDKGVEITLDCFKLGKTLVTTEAQLFKAGIKLLGCEKSA